MSAIGRGLFHCLPMHRGPGPGICCRQAREHGWPEFGRRTQDGVGRELGGEGFLDEARAGCVEALDEAGGKPDHRKRGGYRRQTHSLECSHGALR